MSSLPGNHRGEGPHSSAHGLSWVWGSPGTECEGRAGKIATAGTASNPVHKTNVSHSAFPRSPQLFAYF